MKKPITITQKKSQLQISITHTNGQQSTTPFLHLVSVVGRDEGYTVKYNSLPEGVPGGEARWNS